MRVVALPALSDNYIFMLVSGSRAAAVDPGDARPVLAFLEREALSLEAVLLTHHHGDHTAGTGPLAARFPALRVAGSAADRRRLPTLTDALAPGERFDVLGRSAQVIDVAGHTAAHIAWFVDDGAGGGDLFSGDTVFGGTIGHLFEGTLEQMFAALGRLRALPPASRLWCGHEYTLQFVGEAARFDPGNRALADRFARLEAAAGNPTVPLTLAEECATNPFFRWDEPALARRFGTAPGFDTFRAVYEAL